MVPILVLTDHISSIPVTATCREQPQLVEAHIHSERAAGRVLGPLPPNLARLTHTSSIGLIPKPHQPGKWRHLSSPIVLMTPLD